MYWFILFVIATLTLSLIQRRQELNRFSRFHFSGAANAQLARSRMITNPFQLIASNALVAGFGVIGGMVIYLAGLLVFLG